MQRKSLNSVLVSLSKVDVIKNNCKLVLGVRRHESLILISLRRKIESLPWI